MRPAWISQGMQKSSAGISFTLSLLDPALPHTSQGAFQAAGCKCSPTREFCSGQKLLRISIAGGTNTIKGNHWFPDWMCFLFWHRFAHCKCCFMLIVPQTPHQVPLYTSVPPCRGAGRDNPCWELRGDVRHYFHCQWFAEFGVAAQEEQVEDIKMHRSTQCMAKCSFTGKLLSFRELSDTRVINHNCVQS